MSIPQTSLPATVWDRVVCAVDRTPLSVQAGRAAARLMPAAASLTLCTTVSPDEGGSPMNQARTRAAQDALDRAQAEIQPFHDAELHLREGPPIRRLRDELQAEHATLVAVGSYARQRGGLGSVATAMLQEAP